MAWMYVSIKQAKSIGLSPLASQVSASSFFAGVCPCRNSFACMKYQDGHEKLVESAQTAVCCKVAWSFRLDLFVYLHPVLKIDLFEDVWFGHDDVLPDTFDVPRGKLLHGYRPAVVGATCIMELVYYRRS
eukprot:3901298-Amphidinium_carterae.1